MLVVKPMSAHTVTTSAAGPIAETLFMICQRRVRSLPVLVDAHQNQSIEPDVEDIAASQLQAARAVLGVTLLDVRQN